MRKRYFILIGMLLLSFFALNISSMISADEPHGTRNPDAGVEVTAFPLAQNGLPTKTISYEFTIKNTGDETDNFILSADSSNEWEIELSQSFVGPLNVDESIIVFANVTIPMGWPAYDTDILNLTATSNTVSTEFNKTGVITTVDEGVVVELEIEGGTSWTSAVNNLDYVNYTLILRNMVNEDVIITLHNISDNNSWRIDFSRYPDVNVPKADLFTAGIKAVNVTVTAPQDAPPHAVMNLTIWGEKSDRNWYSYKHQDNITITTIVQPRRSVVFYPDIFDGFVGFRDTLFNFTLENTGNMDLKLDLVMEWPDILIIDLVHDQMVVRVNDLERNTLRVRTASDTQLGNYTINVSCVDNSTGELIAGMEFYYIIVPVLNITNISMSDEEPMQYKTTTVSVTIENIGFVDATNITVILYDGSKKAASTYLDNLSVNDPVATVKIKWAPSEYGNRSIRIAIDVEGVGNFTEHGTDIAEKMLNVNVRINWQPYYLAIYVIIVIILGIAVISCMVSLKYYGGVPHLNHYGEATGEEPYEEFPEEGDFPEEGEEPMRPFGTYGPTAEPKESIEKPLPYEPRRERAARIPPRERREPPPRREKPPERVIAPVKDPETLRKESEAREEISKAQDKLDKTKSLGVDTANIDQLLSTAKRSLSDGDVNKAKQYLGYANERIDNLMSKRDEALKAIKEAKEVLSGMRGTADMTIVENFLVKADSLFAEGDFREAINYANKAKERAVRLQKREMRL
ncbi:MAG: hypothetical protein JSW00_02385 [Thermoplasmata archaeon]|nr:MAG: hypothetical protein JSW00_02385 [Thermoplasmata archaeon]